MAVPDLPSAYKAVEVLQSYTPGCVVLTLGEKGVLFTEKGKPDIVWHQEAEKVKVVDTTVSIQFSAMCTVCTHSWHGFISTMSVTLKQIEVLMYSL